MKGLIHALIKNLSSPDFKKPQVRNILLLCFAIYLMLMLMLGYAWYSKQWASSFHFFNDAAEWKQMDKFAHFFWAFQVSALATRLLTWGTLNEKSASLTGTILGLLFVSSAEIGDGLSMDYGASIFDLLANMLGCTAFLGQRFFWSRVKIWPKFTFHPTSFAPLRPEMLGNDLLSEILKDYNGQTFWYSAHFKILPLPKWLTLAVGIGAEGMIYGRDHQNELMHFSPYRKYLLSLDLNLSHIKTSSKLLGSLLYVLNVIKIPAPTVEFSSRGIKFHPIYF